MQDKVRTDSFKLLRQAMLERWIMASVADGMGFARYWWGGIAKVRRCRHYQVALGSGTRTFMTILSMVMRRWNKVLVSREVGR